MIYARRVVGPCDFYDDEGDCVATGFGIVETDGIETWDVEFPFDSHAEAAKRLAVIIQNRETEN
jgi:hypothetical protein